MAYVGPLINQVAIIRATPSIVPQVENAFRTLDQLLRLNTIVVEGLAPTDLFGDRYSDVIRLTFMKDSKEILQAVMEVWNIALNFHIPDFHKRKKDKKEEAIAEYRQALFPSYYVVIYDKDEKGEPQKLRVYLLEDVCFSEPRIGGNALHPYPEMDLRHSAIVLLPANEVQSKNFKNTLMLYLAKEIDRVST